MKNIRKYSCISLLIGAAITLASALLPMLSRTSGNSNEAIFLHYWNALVSTDDTDLGMITDVSFLLL